MSAQRLDRLGTAKRILAREGGDLDEAMRSPAFRADVNRTMEREIRRLRAGVQDALAALAWRGEATGAGDNAECILRELEATDDEETG